MGLGLNLEVGVPGLWAGSSLPFSLLSPTSLGSGGQLWIHSHWLSAGAVCPESLETYKTKDTFARNWIGQATSSSGAHRLLFLLLLGRDGMGDKQWKLTWALFKIHNPNYYTDFHFAYSLLVAAYVHRLHWWNSIEDEKWGWVARTPWICFIFMELCHLLDCLTSVSPSLEWPGRVSGRGKPPRHASWCHTWTCCPSRWYTGKVPTCTPTTQPSPLGHRCWGTCWPMPSTAWDSPGWVTMAVTVNWWPLDM